MKKYLRELEVAGLALMGIGVVIAHVWGNDRGMLPCTCGMAVLMVPYLYKAFHWNEYERENRRNIWIIVLCIVVIYIQLLILR